MKRDSVKLLCLMVLLAGVFLLPSCAPTLGHVYQKPDKIQGNAGLVYLYRPKEIIGGGVSFTVKANGVPITKLYNCGYYPYFATPGETEFSAKTESKSSVTLDVRAGEKYYIKGSVGVGFFIGRPHLIIVPADIAEKEIAECKLILER